MAETPQRIFLRSKHGLGDNAQLRTVVAHYRHLYPQAYIKVESNPNTYHFYSDLVNEWHRYTYPFHRDGWDICHYIHFGQPEKGLADIPNTKTTWELHKQEITPLPELYGYHCNTDKWHHAKACEWLINNNTRERGMVAVHYEGNSRPERKNLAHSEAYVLCKWLYGEGFQPWLIDFGTSKLDYPCPRKLLDEPDESVANCVELIAQSRFMVCINSGPACFAACTATPAFVLHRGFHPANTFDPADNLIHLLPEDADELLPAENREACLEYFDDHYNAIYCEDVLKEVKGCISEAFAEPYDEELNLRLLKESGGGMWD